MRKATFWLLFLSAAPDAYAQVRAGGEFRVNTYTTSYQTRSSVASTGDGRFVVVWESYAQDGSSWGLFGQRFDARGVAAGGEFRVNTYTTGHQGGDMPPGLGADPQGGFVVTWPSIIQYGAYADVIAQRFTASGSTAGPEFRVNTHTPFNQIGYGLAVGPNGRFVVTWGDIDGDGYGVFARAYDRDGAPAEFQVNTLTAGRQFLSNAGMGADGRFVVAWLSEESSNTWHVQARRFEADGSPLGLEFRVNTSTSGLRHDPAVEVASHGGFLILWGAKAAAGGGVFGRRYDASGTPLGAELRLGEPSAYPFLPSAAFDEVGRFVVTWTDQTAAALDRVRARRFDATGTAIGAEFAVATYTTGFQYRASVAGDAVGNFVVTWTTPTDGSNYSVAAQRFGGLQPAALAVSDAGNGVLEVGESFTLRTGWRNVNGAAQTFQGRASNVVSPPGLTLTLSTDADYGTVADGAVGSCSTCFGGGLAGTRPAGHQDATFEEGISPVAQGQLKRWSLHVGNSFGDVPVSSPFYPFVETLLHRGVTAGCSSNQYCPSSPVTREQVAAFVLIAKEGAGYRPVSCLLTVFQDVPASNPFCPYIEELDRRGVVGGCAPGLFCPSAAVTREQMPVFVLRTLDPNLDPPACTTPMFNDVPASSPFCRWIEELARRGVTAGCGGGNYCPAAPVTREQMAVFLMQTFGLTLYGP